MTDVYVHDTKRNVASSWPERLVDANIATGLVLSLHNSPPAANETGQLRGLPTRRDPVVDAGGAVLIDAGSHFDLSTTDPATYDHWGLWPVGNPGDFLDPATVEAHVARIYEIQEGFGVPLLAPSPPLTRPDAPEAQTVLAQTADLPATAATYGVDDPIATIAGTDTFWAAGDDLDDFIDDVTQAGIRRWYLVPLRASADWPPSPSVDALLGMLRTTYSLHTHSDQVIWANADVVGVSMAAAGATQIGTGFDRKQRCLTIDAHHPVDMSGGRWLVRAHLGHAMCSVKTADARLLLSDDPATAARTIHGGGIPAGAEQSVRQHFAALTDILADISRHAPGDDASDYLLNRVYGRARRLIEDVERATGLTGLLDDWVRPYEQALQHWRDVEGWA